MQIPNSTTKSEPQAPSVVNEPASSTVFSNPIALVELLLGHWMWLVASVLLCSLLGGAYAYFATPIYRATARIEIFNDSRVETRAKTKYDQQEQSMLRQLLLLNSQRLHQQVRLELAPEWKTRLIPSELYVEFNVKSVAGSNGSMIDFTVDSVNAQYSKDYVLSMIDVYRRLRLEKLTEVNESALSGLKREETRVLEELEQAREALDIFESQNQVFLRQERLDMNMAFIDQLLSRLQEVRVERVLLGQQYEQILGTNVLTVHEALAMTRETEAGSQAALDGDSGRPGDAVEGQGLAVVGESSVNLYGSLEARSQWERAQAQLVALMNQLEQQGKVLKSTHPRMIELKQEIESVRSSLANLNDLSLKRFKARFEALKLQESSIEAVIENWHQKREIGFEEENEHRQILSRVKHLEKKYNLVYGRLLENTGTSESFFLREIQEAQARTAPIQPQVMKILLASVVLGMVAGGGLILGLEYLKPTPVNVIQLQRDYNLLMLAQIRRWDLYLSPNQFNPESDIFVAAKGTNQVATETYRRIRLNLLKQFGEGSAVSFTITSSNSGDGKTFNVANIALPFAWVGKRVLLIDADLRRGSLTRRLLGRELRHGLADWLADDSCDVRTHIMKVKHEPLSILPSGVFNDSLPELVQTERLRDLLQSLHEDFDVIIVDTAPVNIFSESMPFCQATGGVVVMMDSLSKQSSVENCLSELRGMRLLGFCVNNVDDSYLRSHGYDTYGNYGMSHIESAFVYGMNCELPKKKRWKFGL
ncbi:polysaccharide biosynthesis tyrosine autokinase [Coraliomargarita algicola]|uniref:Polysaccharide biosynthesis tyrosine autokinase n=1 Tax=Coraliomargarita algicola TaxID=3092156 RepID=A0ABZ0RS50_9BACT|nr:polysaccharide biosynthesis tyrosine autokinase [Coraliomargarita sp. J2-16]WPJ97732.1 polysaccharide biosynthesis tyrosine autokinase [Coraliomargarita sp. J2-16]